MLRDSLPRITFFLLNCNLTETLDQKLHPPNHNYLSILCFDEKQVKHQCIDAMYVTHYSS